MTVYVFCVSLNPIFRWEEHSGISPWNCRAARQCSRGKLWLSLKTLWTVWLLTRDGTIQSHLMLLNMVYSTVGGNCFSCVLPKSDKAVVFKVYTDYCLYESPKCVCRIWPWSMLRPPTPQPSRQRSTSTLTLICRAETLAGQLSSPSGPKSIRPHRDAQHIHTSPSQFSLKEFYLSLSSHGGKN